MPTVIEGQLSVDWAGAIAVPVTRAVLRARPPASTVGGPRPMSRCGQAHPRERRPQRPPASCATTASATSTATCSAAVTTSPASRGSRTSPSTSTALTRSRSAPPPSSKLRATSAHQRSARTRPGGRPTMTYDTDHAISELVAVGRGAPCARTVRRRPRRPMVPRQRHQPRRRPRHGVPTVASPSGASPWVVHTLNAAQPGCEHQWPRSDSWRLSGRCAAGEHDLTAVPADRVVYAPGGRRLATGSQYCRCCWAVVA